MPLGKLGVAGKEAEGERKGPRLGASGGGLPGLEAPTATAAGSPV